MAKISSKKIKATINYFLSQQGQKLFLKQGGNGHKNQSISGLILHSDIDLFSIDDLGNLTLNLTSGSTPDFSFLSDLDNKTLASHQKLLLAIENNSWETLFFDCPKDFNELLDLHKQIFSQRFLLKADAEALKNQFELQASMAIKDFLDNSSLRATFNDTTNGNTYVTIPGCNQPFYSQETIYQEALNRKSADEYKAKEERQNAKKSFFQKWVMQNGSKNQQERHIAGLLPEKEILDTVKKQLFSPLQNFPLYNRITIEDLCRCTKACEIQCESFQATEATAQEWDLMQQIKHYDPNLIAANILVSLN